MTEPSASRTADGVALIRAVHQLLDDQPPILDDPVSLLLVGQSMVEVIRRHPEKATVPAAAALRSHVVLRSRYAEDRLLQAM
jgi:O-methyltransferase involved in polyketide biosynthesis